MDDIYVVYSVDKSYEGKAIYPDDPRVLETLVKGYSSAEAIVMYYRGIDDSRIYGYECWGVFEDASSYFRFLKEIEE